MAAVLAFVIVGGHSLKLDDGTGPAQGAGLFAETASKHRCIGDRDHHSVSVKVVYRNAG